MILKLSYKDEIHRVSDAPNRLSDLYALIVSSFRANLPQQISLFYSIKDEVEDTPINSQEDYDALISKGTSKPVKIHIKETSTENKLFEPVQADYDVIAKNDKTKDPAEYNSEEKKEESANDKLMSMGGLVENISESVVIPQIPKYPYIARPEESEKDVRTVVREILREELPFIISQVREAILKELKASLPVNQPKPEPNNVYNPYVRVANRAEDEDKKVDLDLRASEVRFENIDNMYRGDNEEAVLDRPALVQGQDKNDLLNKMKQFGTALKEQFSILPSKAKNAFDDLSQKLEGDPYVSLEEGKFPKSVVDKVNLLKEIFPEEERGMLLQFVKRYPRNVTLEQLADSYLFKDEPQEEQNARNV